MASAAATTEGSCTSGHTDASSANSAPDADGVAGARDASAVATEKQLKHALKSIKVFKQQQQQLFDEFVLLRSK